MPSSGDVAKEQAPRVSKSSLLATTWSLFGVSVFFFVARIGVRLAISRRLYTDDGWALAGIIILLGLAICLTVAVPTMYEVLDVSSGLKPPALTFFSAATGYLKLQFALTMLYWSCLWAVKACFLAFFHRLTKGLKYCTWAWYGIAIITSLGYIGCVITYPVSCSSFAVGACETEIHVYRSLVSLRYSVAIDLITDAMIIALPLYLALRVQLPLIDRLALAGIFSLGGLIMLISIIRIAVTNRHNTRPETTWLNLWSQIEASVAVIVSSLAPFKALFASRKSSSYRQSGSTNNRRKGPSDTLGTERSGASVGIPLDDRDQEFGQQGTITIATRADSTERILETTPHIVKTLEIRQDSE